MNFKSRAERVYRYLEGAKQCPKYLDSNERDMLFAEGIAAIVKFEDGSTLMVGNWNRGVED